VTGGQSAYPSWCRAPLWGPWPDFSFSFLLPDDCFALRLGAPSLTRGRVCNLYCSLSVVRVTEDSSPSHPRLLRSLCVASYDSQGLRWKYFYPPPEGEPFDTCRFVLLRVGPKIERSLFLLLLWSVIDIRNMWEVPMQGSPQSIY
jgi:hypothetical protein